MDYKLAKLEDITLVGKTFTISTSEIQTANYQAMYGEVCKGLSPKLSYGVYQVTDEETKFTVAIDTDVENDLEPVTVIGGEFYQFEIDMMKNMEENQYAKCYEQIMADGVDFDMSYGIEIMDNSFDPSSGSFIYNYYLKK